jgi:small-conductance mechanosensitive channel
MNLFFEFFNTNKYYLDYLLFIISLIFFACLARVITHFIFKAFEKSQVQRSAVEHFTPLLILIFIVASQGIFLFLFDLSPEIEGSFFHFLNTQILWVILWIIIVILHFCFNLLPPAKAHLKKIYPALRILLPLILLLVTYVRDLDRLISTGAAFIISLLAFKLSIIIDKIQFGWGNQIAEEQETKKIVARWDMINITLPFNTPKEKVDRALNITKQCLKDINNVGEHPSVFLKDFSERGIVIEVKYLVLVSTKMKETKHEILSRILTEFSSNEIPLSK